MTDLTPENPHQGWASVTSRIRGVHRTGGKRLRTLSSDVAGLVERSCFQPDGLEDAGRVALPERGVGGGGGGEGKGENCVKACTNPDVVMA